MQMGGPHILAAMDGKEVGDEQKGLISLDQKEPAAYFYVIFGPVYEALSTS